MATVAVGTQNGLQVLSTTDRELLRGFLERDRLLAAYAICDLEDREFGRTRWGIATQGGEVVAIAMEYGGLTPQPMFVMGDNEGIAAGTRARPAIHERSSWYCLSPSTGVPTPGRAALVQAACPHAAAPKTRAPSARDETGGAS